MADGDVRRHRERSDDDQQDVDVAIDARVRRRDAFLHRRLAVCEPFQMHRLLDPIVARGGVVVAIDDFVRVETKVPRILANESSGEHRSREYAVVVALDRFEKTLADLGGVRDFLQRDAADLPFASKLLAKGRQLRVRLGIVFGHEDGYFTYSDNAALGDTATPCSRSMQRRTYTVVFG